MYTLEVLVGILYIIPGICLGRYWANKNIGAKEMMNNKEYALIGVFFLVAIVVWLPLVGVALLQPYFNTFMDSINKPKNKEETTDVANV